ncbi:MAG: alkaline phosphatase family protein [Acidobacteriota bacterium]
MSEEQTLRPDRPSSPFDGAASRARSQRIRRTRDLLACGFLPGSLAGFQLAGLLFFLNPHVPFEWPSAARGFLFFALLLGLAAMVLVVVLTGARARTARRLLPILLTAALLIAALGFWVHASYFGFYLPPGINARLLKAAVWLTLAAVLCFYTLVLHRLRRRPIGRRSRALFALMALASVYVVVERREAFKPRVDPDPRATAFENERRPQLLVVGLETASLDVVLPLAQQGRLPFFRRVLDGGIQSRLTSLSPTRRSPLWTTLATGKYPYKHGVVGERLYEGYLGRRQGPWLSLLPLGLESWGDWVSSREADAGDVRVLTLWRILARLGVSTGVVGWPLTSPVSEELTAVLPDRFFAGDSEITVHPAEMAERARLFRTRLGELDPETVSRFGVRPPQPVLDALVDDLWREDLAQFLLDGDPKTDALFLLLPGLRELSLRYFGGFSAVQFRGLQDPESVDAARLLSAYYEHLDASLARLWASMEGPKMMVIVSAHGVHEAPLWEEARRVVLRRQPPTRGSVHEGPDGLLLAIGEGIVTSGSALDARLVDLTPTLLYSLGLPVARDLDGSVLTGVFENSFMARQPLNFVPSYETLPSR